MGSGLDIIRGAGDPNFLSLERVTAHTDFTVTVLLVAPVTTVEVVVSALVVPMILIAFVTPIVVVLVG